MQIKENVPIAPFTYYKIGGPARYYCQPETTQDLIEVARFLREKDLPYFILGAGSNVLIDDAGVEGLVLHTSKLGRALEAHDGSVEVGAGLTVIQLLRQSMAQGWDGLEFLVGIPGNMGGVLYMNAGTKLGEVKDAVQEVRVFNLQDGKEKIFSGQALSYRYRKNLFLRPHDVILGGRFRYSQAPSPESVQKKVQDLLEARRKSQPVDKPSCGSVFKNPDPSRGIYAWKLINEVGLRGHRIGNAQVSELHTNYIINLGGALASDVKALIAEAKSRVLREKGIALEEEVRIIPRVPSARLGTASA